MMKKSLFVLIAHICLIFSANAQSCVIAGADDGSTIVVQSCYLNGDKVIVNLINDSNDIAANVTINVKVTYKSGNYVKTQNYSGREISLAKTSTKIEIPIERTHSSGSHYVVDSVEPISVSGNKCN